MLIRTVFVLSLTLCLLGGTEAILDMTKMTGFALEHSKLIGIEVPGYVKMLSSKSSILTRPLHYIFGDHLEDRVKNILQTAVAKLQDEAVIEDVNNDNPEKMTFLHGKMTGLKSIEFTPNSEVSVVPTDSGLVSAVVSVRFKDLRINADIKTKFKLKNVEGNADMKFLKNNFVLRFRMKPGIKEWCYLELYDVVCSDLEDVEWTVRRPSDNTVDTVAGMVMQGYFTSTDNEVENHIKTSITNVIYHEIPKASPQICDNREKHLKLSKYQTFKKTNTDKNQMSAVLEEEKKKKNGDQEQQQTKEEDKEG